MKNKKMAHWQPKGSKVEMGLDPILGFNGTHILPNYLIQHIHNLGIYYINQIQVALDQLFTYPIWIWANDLGLFRDLAGIWDNYIQNIIMEGITLNEEEDMFTRARNMV